MDPLNALDKLQKVTLDADPERMVVIPLTTADLDGASDADYSGVPPSLTFNSGDTERSFVFTAEQDTEDDNEEKVRIGLGTLPARVTAGSVAETTVTILNCDGGGIWCGTVGFAVDSSYPNGRKRLVRTHGNYEGTLDNDLYFFNGITYKVSSMSLNPALFESTTPTPPFGLLERASFRIRILNEDGADAEARIKMPNEDYLDWTLILSAEVDGEMLEAALPFNEAKFCCDSSWRWYGLDVDNLNGAWEQGKLYSLRIVEDPRADRAPAVSGPPLYLQVQFSNRNSASIKWVRPQIRNDGAPPGVNYKVQWKEASGRWDTPADVSEAIYELPPNAVSLRWEVLYWKVQGLTAGTRYHVRVIAVNAAGDSEPSNIASFRAVGPVPGQGGEAGSNTAATGAPAITGTPRVGEILAADTSGITDADGLDNVEYAHQWLADDADIDGATGSTYTVDAGDEGKAIRVRVTFTDDAGNEESLTSAPTEPMAPPALRPESATVDGAALVLTFNHTLDEGVSLPTSAFTVTVGGATRTVNEALVSGTAVTLTLASAVVAGETVTVDYTKPEGPDFIRDTLGNVADSFTGQAVVNETPAFSEQRDAAEPLTAAVHDSPESHDGETAFTFELRLSEEPEEDFSYVTMRDHAFTVTGGTVTGARSLDPPGNMRWEISVQPDSGRDVTVVLEPTTDCEDQGAICTGDGRMLASAISLPIPGPSTPATGTPAVSGMAKAGQTLTADTSGIGDADGMENAAFEYRWLADDADIAGATNSSYALTDSDVGKIFRVRVSFTDDNGNRETLTSQPTAAVAPTVPTEPLGLTVRRGDQTQELDVTWQAPSSDGSSAVTGYRAQWKEAADSWDIPADVSEETVAGTSYTISGLTGGEEYTVRVIAVNGAGDGPASAEVTGTPAGGTSEQDTEPENNAPTGLPAISGTARVGRLQSRSRNLRADIQEPSLSFGEVSCQVAFQL